MQKLTFFLLVVFFTFFSVPLSAQTDELYFSLTDASNAFGRFYLIFSDSYSEKYIASEDAETMSTYYSDRPALYCLDGANKAMVLYGVPMKNDRVIPIGFSVPDQGTYTFKMESRKRQKLRVARLIDNDENKTINLLQNPTYTFTTSGEVKSNTSRFTLFINPIDKDPVNTLPGIVMISGKVRISGTMRSEGAVHIIASGDTGKVHIDNSASAMLMADTILLYSNDVADGLLLNQNVGSGGVKGIDNYGLPTIPPKRVIFRKSIEENVYTYLSVPFDVQEDQVSSAGRRLHGGDSGNDYWAFKFNAKVRSDSSTVNSQKTWMELDYTKGFEKGTGYMVWFEPGTSRAYMDFMTETPAIIENLFDAAIDKTKPYKIYGVDPSLGWNNPEYGDGWAFVGGLNTTTFTLKKGNIKDYGGTSVWYRKEQISQALGTQHDGYAIAIISENDSINISPYAPFWIQDTINVVAGDSAIRNFTYQSLTGLSVESSQFRSVNENKRDRLYFALSSDKDNSFDRFYLVFADNYEESYRASEDAVTMSTSFEDSPAVWSLQDKTNRELALNGLPMKDERKVGMGFSVPEAGDYTLRLDALKLTDVRNVILVDNITGRKVDLLQTPYSFNTEAVVKENNRFALFINSSYTDIPSLDAVKPYAYTKDNVLTIKNLSEGDNVSVYDLAGRTIVSGKATGKEFSTGLSQKGVYVVNVKGGEITVLKVLNK